MNPVTFPEHVHESTKTVMRLLEVLERIRSTSSAIERGHEPWREGVQYITRIAMEELEQKG